MGNLFDKMDGIVVESIVFPPVDESLLSNPVKDKKYYEALIYKLRLNAGLVERDAKLDEVFTPIEEFTDIIIELTDEARTEDPSLPRAKKPSDLKYYQKYVEKRIIEIEIKAGFRKPEEEKQGKVKEMTYNS